MAELACQRYADAYGLQAICLRINHNWTIFGRPGVSAGQGLKRIQIFHSILAILVCAPVAFLQ